ncbi:MAG: hypothetical protein ASARMPRED_008547 [Alectoria sarmentosa]|nr:MAG: hypothetical protein ASARMPRED_008547 [Alectoria sarmentosa]
MAMADEEIKAPNAPHGVTSTTSSFNDWPNDAGFETFHEETDPVQLKVSGRIPAYAAGILYRTGPGGHQVTTPKNKTFAVSHWFDGFSQTHRFELLPPSEGEVITRVRYNSRHTCDRHVEKIRDSGEMATVTFGQQQDPCESFFKKVMSSFQAATAGGDKAASEANVGVTIKANLPVPGALAGKEKARPESKDNSSPKIDNLWLQTDNASLQCINPTTLEPIDVVRQPKLHPDLKGPFTGAHSRTDPTTGDWYNYNLEIGRQATYRVFSVSAKTGETTVLATLTGGPIRAAYLHSILLTERYVILCIFDAYYAKGGLKVLWTRNMLDAMEFDPNKKNLWLVIDRRHGQGLVGMYESDPFFAFHPVNAWEQASETEPGKVDIVTDIPTYPNLDVLKRFYYHNMKGTAPGARNYVDGKGATSKASLTRFRLPNIGSTRISPTTKPSTVSTVSTAAKEDTPELPTFNPDYATKPSRYIYGVCDRGNSTFLDGLIKYDTRTQTSMARVVHAQSPGEPIFLADPDGEDEDEGVCLSVVLDGTRGRSYLLVLDARTWEEVGRAEMECVVPFGFHGTHFACEQRSMM